MQEQFDFGTLVSISLDEGDQPAPSGHFRKPSIQIIRLSNPNSSGEMGSPMIGFGASPRSPMMAWGLPSNSACTSPAGGSPPMNGNKKLCVFYPSVLEIGAAGSAESSVFPTSRAEYRRSSTRGPSSLQSMLTSSRPSNESSDDVGTVPDLLPSTNISYSPSTGAARPFDPAPASAAAAPTPHPQTERKPEICLGGFTGEELKSLKLAKRYHYCQGSKDKINVPCPSCNHMNQGLVLACLESTGCLCSCTRCGQLFTHSEERFHSVRALLGGEDPLQAPATKSGWRKLLGGNSVKVSPKAL